MPKTKLLAVTGNPVMHSMSPLIFNSLFRETGIDAHYLRLAAANAGEAIKTAKDMGLHGLNVTSPFKEEIIPFLEHIDPHAAKIQAVNCLVQNNDFYIGFNTDYIGVLKALKMNNVDPKHKRIAVLGSGGAARSAVYSLTKAGAARVTLLNRSDERAKKVAQRLGCQFASLKQAKEILDACDVLISCLPSKHRIFEPSFMNKTLVVLDANYRSSSLIEDAKARGCQTINGLDWLVYQAFPAFKIFTKKKIPEQLSMKITSEVLQNKTAKKPNIALIGFMGSGKTEVGRQLADKKRFGYLDTDSLVQKIAGKSITNIFNSWGESSFRAMEQSVIRKAIHGSRGYVFSLGGGAILNQKNARILRESCHMVWLWISSRSVQIRADISNRPLLHMDNSSNNIEQMFEERIPCYAKTSDLVISNELCEAERTAEKIKYEMDQTFRN